jgi:hypothetical protein
MMEETITPMTTKAVANKPANSPSYSLYIAQVLGTL